LHSLTSEFLPALQNGAALCLKGGAFGWVVDVIVETAFQLRKTRVSLSHVVYERLSSLVVVSYGHLSRFNVDRIIIA
jgi:hypothetical protein